MKKLLYLMIFLFFCNNVKADIVIGDPFKAFLKSLYPSCFYVDTNQVEWFSTSNSLITSEDSLDMSNFSYPYPDLTYDLEGIQYFTSLKYLNLKGHPLNSSPALPASLIYLNISNCAPWTPAWQIPTEIFPNTLRYLDCSDNYGTLYAWPDSLHYINCSGNTIGVDVPMPALPSHMDTFICMSQQRLSPSGNGLFYLPTLPATLKYLNCADNALITLPALPASLRYLDCSSQNTRTNPQTTEMTFSVLPSLPDGLDTLKCNNNAMTTLPALPSSLRYLDCSTNRFFLWELGTPGTYTPNTVVNEGINLLPPLPASLEYLNCSYNNLTSLPPLPASLKFFDCSYNVYPGLDPQNGWVLQPQTTGITSLPSLPSQLQVLGCNITQVYCVPFIPASLTNLGVDHDKVNCLPNAGNYTVYGGPIPVCTFLNNSNQCPILTSCYVTGNIFSDNNSNGIKDPGENYRPNVELQLSNGLHAYTSDSGYFAMYVDTGSYTLTVVDPSFYNAVPSTLNYHFSNYDTTVHEMIALQPAVSIDSVTVSIVPLNLPRLFHTQDYKITYENTGTTTISPSIVFNYDNTRLNYLTCSNASVINNGNQLSLAEANLSPGTVHSFTTSFGLTVAAAMGDTLHASAIATAGTSTSRDSAYTVVIGPIDPNDKNATPSLTPQQVATGTYINYVVRFQNTGTASAIRVVVTDTLSGFLDPSTFKMINASHTCQATRIGNKISFLFSNIMLPDSTTNEPGSHGFIRFAVKPLTSVPVNTIIPNNASIYFDFNQPVVTNTATTTIHLASDVVLPDGLFKTFLKNKYPSCFYVDGNQVEWMNTICSEITSEDSLDLTDLGYSNSSYLDLEGIQYFTSLKYLNCTHNLLMSSPPLPSTLTKLIFVEAINDQPYGSFPSNFLPKGLRYLDMHHNYMYAPAAWPDSLHYLNCSDNSIGTLTTLPLYLDTLICSRQQTYGPFTNILTALPTLPVTLKYLDCADNALNSLPGLPASLKYLDCSKQDFHTNPENIDYSLASLPPLPAGLETLNCSYNKLTALPALPLSLHYLNCSRTRIFYNETHPGSFDYSLVYEGIDVLPDLPASLTYLNCSYNKLTSLPNLPAMLTYLDCSANTYSGYQTNGPLNPITVGIASLQRLPNQLDTLYCEFTMISCIPRIPASLTALSVNRDKVTCLPNSGNYTVVGGPIPLCTIFNNPNECPSTGVVSGNIFYDLNSNSIKDPGENYRANVHMQLSNGMNGYTDNNGYYELSADPGNYTLSVEAPALYAAVPSPINYSVNSYDTIIYDNIALQPTISLDSVTLSVIDNNFAVPGFTHVYNIKYENVGTTVLSPSIQFNYDANRLTYLGSSNAAVVNNGSSLNLSQVNTGPGEVYNFTATFTLNLSAIPGDTLLANAKISGGTCTATDSSYAAIVASHDPNDKNATPILTTQQVANGSYINYVIRFQNTGTFAATNIIVTDTLSSFLDASSFKMVDISHRCRTTRIGNKISFEFLNIVLPDSTTNELASHGFIRFAVKPVASVPVNTVIPNTASIYFDFNQPAITNIANTSIKLWDVAPPLPPPTTISFTASADANNNALLNWNTANEFNTSSFDIEQSIDGTIFSMIGTKAAIGTGDHAYSYTTIIPADIVYYRIKMNFLDGSVTYSDTVQVNKNKRSEPIVVLSNPAKNTLSLIISDVTLVNTTASLINELGAIVKRFVLKEGLQNIDVSNLSTGVYYLKISTKAKKIMINH